MEDLYKILNVEKNASAEEIKKAFEHHLENMKNMECMK